MKKNVLYYGVSITLVILGAALSITGILPVENNTAFLLGLLWIWQGIALLMKLDTPRGGKYTRKIQIGLGICDIVLGTLWVPMALMKFSNEAWPLLITAGPVLIAEIVLVMREKK